MNRAKNFIVFIFLLALFRKLLKKAEAALRILNTLSMFMILTVSSIGFTLKTRRMESIEKVICPLFITQFQRKLNLNFIF